MGTNYYYRTNACKTCGHSEYEIHIGKNSYGWQFSFQSAYECRSWKDWQLLFESCEGDIYDEYGDKMSVKDFKELVKTKQIKGLKNHAELYSDRCFIDDEGYSFSEYEFF